MGGPPARPHLLARADDAVVPRLQAQARATAGGLGLPLRLLERIDHGVLQGRAARSLFRRRRLVTLVTVLLGVSGAGVHFDRYHDLEQAEADARVAAAAQAVRIPGDPLAGFDSVGGAAAHGPGLGSDPQDWIDQRRGVLAGLGPGTHSAVVSFDGFRSADVAAGLLVGLTPLRAQYRLPDVGAPALETDVAAGDLEASVGRIVADALAAIVEEQMALQDLVDSGTVEDPAFEADNRNRIEELRAVRNVLELTGEVVFAVVVEGDRDLLVALGERIDVRLVDPLPEGADPLVVAAFGLLPDDRTTVTFGRAS